MSAQEPTEEEMRAALEEEMRRVRPEEVLLQSVVSLVNLGMRRTGMVPGTEPERDLDQVRLCIESVRALGPVLDQAAPEQAAAIRDALSQLQMAYVQAGGGPGPEAPAAPAQPAPPPERPEPPPSRLWVPGQ